MYRRIYQNNSKACERSRSVSTSGVSDVSTIMESNSSEPEVVFDEEEEAKMKEIVTDAYSKLAPEDVSRFFQYAAKTLKDCDGKIFGTNGYSILEALTTVEAKYPDKCAEMGDCLTAFEVPALFVRVLRKRYSERDLEKLQDYMVDLLISLLISCTDSSEKFIKSLAKEGAIEFFTEILSRVCTECEDEEMSELKEGCLSILHNIARDAEFKGIFKEAKTSKAVLPCIQSCEDEELTAVAVLTLAHIADEEDNDSLMDNTNTIGNCVKWLSYALEDENKRMMGFSAWELTLGLAKLAVNDHNKQKIVEEGALESLLSLLKGTDKKEQAAAAECLWTLAFDEDVRGKILNYPKLVSALETFKDSSDKDVKKNVRGALWMIQGNNTSHVSTANTENDNHIFISYSWNEKDLVKKLHKSLVDTGYKVWVDWEQMGGSTLQAMAEAVEKSAVVLICMSEKYKQSPNCRTEAEYTFQQRKEYIPLLLQQKYKPDGWLGAMLGAKLFFDFSGKYPYEKKWMELCRELKGKVASVGGLDMVDSRPVATPKRSCMGMSKADVQALLESKGLEKLPTALYDYDGQLLWQLKKLRENDPRYFHKTIEKEFDMKLTDILRLNAALDELH